MSNIRNGPSSFRHVDIPVVSAYPTPALALQMRISSGNLHHPSLSRHSKKSGTILRRGDAALLRKSTPNRMVMLSVTARRCSPCSLAAHYDITRRAAAAAAAACDASERGAAAAARTYFLHTPYFIAHNMRIFFHKERPRPPMIQIGSIS